MPLKCISNNSTMQILAESESKLFRKEDIIKYKLLETPDHDAVKYFIELDPTVLYTEDEEGNFPIVYSEDRDMIRLYLDSALKFDPSHPSIGGLFQKDKYRHTNIECIIADDCGASKTISQVLSHYKHIPILQHLIKHTPKLLETFITDCPHASFVRDNDGRLPIHTALETGMKKSIGLVALMNANNDHLGDIDPVTKLCPSALAAMEPACDLDTIYHLIRMHPTHVERGIDNKKYISEKKNTHGRKRKMHNASGTNREKR